MENLNQILGFRFLEAPTLGAKITVDNDCMIARNHPFIFKSDVHEFIKLYKLGANQFYREVHTLITWYMCWPITLIYSVVVPEASGTIFVIGEAIRT